MPMRTVTVRRWEVAMAFILLTVVFTVIVVWLTRIATDAHHAATEARSDTHHLARVDHRVIRLRNEQIRLLCRGERANSQTLQKILNLSREFTARDPTATPREREQAARFYRRALRLTTPLDCRRLTRLHGTS